MRVLGLTGGIGMGKSTCAQLLGERGIPVVDTDDLARQVVEPGEPALAEVEGQFGLEVIDAQGRLRRGALAARVFADLAARKKLEEILHPRIRQLWRERIRVWANERHPCAVVVIPLLFETHAEQELDATICVACSATTQQQRLSARGWSREEIERRIGAQWPIQEKLTQADFVIWTEGSLAIHVGQLERILKTAR